ncbi:MAG TPA: hypothetical protein VF122_06125 [Caulobacteraceae bacterium]
MKTLLKAAAMAAVIAIGAGSAASAQNAGRTYEQGPVWQISYVETKPGMFDDYMAYLGATYKAIQEEEMKAGNVLEWHVLAVNDPRDGEPDVILITKLKNMAVGYDRSFEEGDEMNARAFGSVKQSNVASVKREDVRTLRGSLSSREILVGKK